MFDRTETQYKTDKLLAILNKAYSTLTKMNPSNSEPVHMKPAQKTASASEIVQIRKEGIPFHIFI